MEFNVPVEQRVFAEIADQLDPRARRLLAMPDYAQVDENLVNMANYFPLIQGLIDAVEPESICEIGSDQGMTTRLLREYCRRAGCTLNSVDPSFKTSEQLDELTRLHKCCSLEYLRQAGGSNVYFIDGDHNYYTVINELRAIGDKVGAAEDCVIFLHDIGWPWGAMDMYYRKESIPDSDLKEAEPDPLVSMYKDPKKEWGEGLPMNGLHVATDDHERAGVANAIEQFLEEMDGWNYMSIPSLFGLGVLSFCGSGSERFINELKKVQLIFDTIRPFLSILEFNRIRLLETINRAGTLWSLQRESIDRCKETITRQQEEISRLESRLRDDK